MNEESPCISTLFHAIAFSGAANLNPTIVVIVVEDTTIRINAYAKEGSINQHTAQKAVKRITELIESK